VLIAQTPVFHGRPHITLRDTATQRPHPITLDEILSTREIGEPRRSPDGRRVAFLVSQAFRSCNCYRTALYVVDAAGRSRPRKLHEAGALTKLSWTPDGHGISYLSDESGSVQLWNLDLRNGEAAPVFVHAATLDRSSQLSLLRPSTAWQGILDYQWSPGGQRVAFTALSLVDSSAIRRDLLQGVRFDDTRMTFLDLVDERWATTLPQLWMYDVRRGQQRLLWAPAAWSMVGIQSMAWAPDGADLAVSYDILGDSSSPGREETARLGILRLRDASFSVLVAANDRSVSNPVWGPRGDAIAYYARNDATQSAVTMIPVANRTTRVVASGAASSWGNHSAIWWNEAGDTLVFESEGLGLRRERCGLYRVAVAGGALQRVTSLETCVSDCDRVMDGRLVCVEQSGNVAPAPALVDLATGRTRRLATINPQATRWLLGKVSQLHWTNRYGAETNGYLIAPVGYEVGTRCPLLIITYGFRGEYLTQAESWTSFPAQAFAGSGFAVLLMNAPRYDDWPPGDRILGQRAFAYSPLASTEAIIRQLADEGIIDSTRVGMMGTSFGAMWTDFVLTHSSLVQAAATVAGPGADVSVYALQGTRAVHQFWDNVVGGPPEDSTLITQWLPFSTALNARSAHAPLLIQADSREALASLEWYAALRRHHKPVDLILFPAGGHVFTQPEHRFYSMQRSLEWFDYWLRGVRDPDPAKAEQYSRWDSMAAEWHQSRSGGASVER
jgi:dipeptidyl aminopeptidase/acylaminoacyl peptidase